MRAKQRRRAMGTSVRSASSQRSSVANATVFNQCSMSRFDASPRTATPKGHNPHHLHSTASRRTTYPRIPLSALMAHNGLSTVDSRMLHVRILSGATDARSQ